MFCTERPVLETWPGWSWADILRLPLIQSQCQASWDPKASSRRNSFQCPERNWKGVSWLPTWTRDPVEENASKVHEGLCDCGTWETCWHSCEKQNLCSSTQRFWTVSLTLLLKILLKCLPHINQCYDNNSKLTIWPLATYSMPESHQLIQKMNFSRHQPLWGLRGLGEIIH